MQVKFRQVTRNGCVSLSVANIFDDHRFTVGLEDIAGETYHDLNLKLAGFGFEIFADCIFLTSQYFRTSNGLTKSQGKILFRYSGRGMTKKIRQTTVVPYLFTVASGRRGRNHHMVAVFHNLSDGLFHVIDSEQSQIKVFSLGELLKRLHIISVALFRLTDNQEPGNFVTLDKSELSHVFSV